MGSYSAGLEAFSKVHNGKERLTPGVMIEDPELIHSHLVRMGKIIKREQNKNNKRTYLSARIANCAGSTLSKHNKGCIVVLTQHTTLAVLQTQCRTYTQHAALAEVPTKYITHMHSTLR